MPKTVKYWQRQGDLVRALALLTTLLLMPGCLSNFTDPEVIPDEWPDSKVSLYPGAQLSFKFDGYSTVCTAGFMFASADNSTLYLSVTAHCLHNTQHLSVGDPAYAEGHSKSIGTIAFDGWANGDESLSRDFALIALDNRASVREHAHPGVAHWGGPTGVAASATIPPGAAVIGYGNSPNRDGGTSLSGRHYFTLPEGPVALTGTEGTAHVDVNPDVISGDSGGPLMLATGQAIGLLHGHLSDLPTGEQVALYTPIDAMLSEIRGQGGKLAGLQLATWPMS